jgi:hypothetical protein
MFGARSKNSIFGRFDVEQSALDRLAIKVHERDPSVKSPGICLACRATSKSFDIRQTAPSIWAAQTSGCTRLAVITAESAIIARPRAIYRMSSSKSAAWRDIAFSSQSQTPQIGEIVATLAAHRIGLPV